MCRTTSMWQWAVTTVRYWLGSLQISGKLRIDHSWSPLESEKLQFLNWVEEMCKELDLDVDDLCLDQHTFPQYWIWYDEMRCMIRLTFVIDLIIQDSTRFNLFFELNCDCNCSNLMNDLFRFWNLWVDSCDKFTNQIQIWTHWCWRSGLMNGPYTIKVVEGCAGAATGTYIMKLACIGRGESDLASCQGKAGIEYW